MYLGWVLNISEAQRLISIGMPSDISSRPIFINAISRGEYADDCMDICRMASAFLLALDTLCSDLNNPERIQQNQELNCSKKEVPSDVFSLIDIDTTATKSDANKVSIDNRNESEKIPPIPILTGGKEEIELLKMELVGTFY